MTDEYAAPQSLQREADRARCQLAHATLRSLEALLNVEGSDNLFSSLFLALNRVFPHDRAIVVEQDGDALLCTASSPKGATGRRWLAAAFPQEVLRGDVLRIGFNDSEARFGAVGDVIAADDCALLMPIGVRGRAAALVLQRGKSKGPFSEADIALARRCAVVSLPALGTRPPRSPQGTGETAGPIESGQEPNAELLKDVIDALPIGLTVQDDSGRFVLVNAVAAGNLGTSTENLIGASPRDLLSEKEAARRRQWELDLVQSGQETMSEETIPGATGERTWLSCHKPAKIHGRDYLVSTALDVTERKDLENNLVKCAYYDDLTGLPNRILIEDRVHQLLQQGGDSCRFALAFLDLDNFKHINDYFSHAIGDALLVKAAQRIQQRLRDSDMLARISGDEFLLLIHPLDGGPQVTELIDRIADDLKQPFHIESFEIFTSASLGVSIHPDHGTTYESLRRNADNAMYRAKHNSKGAAIYFDASMGENITARMELEQRLRLAIRDGKFCCAFQPKVDIQTQEVVGFETLVRWRDEAGDIQPPSSFIDLAIELGLIDPITQFVLAETLKSIERLDEAFGPGKTLSVNIAAKQAGDLKFMQTLLDVLKESACPDRIIFELTEDAFLAKNRFQVQVLPLLRALGVRVSIDDFGTGYSSLSVLADITADEVKVDRSFITAINQRPRSQSVLKTIESLCIALGMTVVAEGVETFEELAYLRTASRIRYAQGFYFSKPFFLQDLTENRRTNPGREGTPSRGSFFSRKRSESPIARG